MVDLRDPNAVVQMSQVGDPTDFDLPLDVKCELARVEKTARQLYEEAFDFDPSPQKKINFREFL